MIFLILSILSSVCLYIVFKLIAVNKVVLLPVILVNYSVCVLLGLAILGPDLIYFKEAVSVYSIHHYLFLGIIFVLIFVLMGKTTAYFGVAVTSVATKMALVIPALFFFFSEDMKPQWIFWPGLILSVPGLYLLIYSKNEPDNQGARPYWIPVLVWLGSGAIDTLLKISETKLSGLPNKEIWLSVAIFTGAFISGFLYWMFSGNKKQMPFSKQVFRYGILLGIPNLGSIGFLLLALSSDLLKPSVLFPINNLGIVFISILVSIYAYRIYTPLGKEHFTNSKKWGIVLALTALVLLSFSN